MDKIIELAESLSGIRSLISAEEKIFEEKTAKLKEEKDALQASLISALEESKLKSIKTSKGDNYSLSVREGFEIVNELQAFKWALENKTVSIDKRLVAQKLKDIQELPSGFERVETKYISIRKAKEELPTN